MASCDPSESPSGRACEVNKNRCRARISRQISVTTLVAESGGADKIPSTGCSSCRSVPAGWVVIQCLSGRPIAEVSAAFSAVGGSRAGVDRLPVRLALRIDLVKDLFDAIAAFDRLIEEEFELGHALQPQPASDLAAQKGGCPV